MGRRAKVSNKSSAGYSDIFVLEKSLLLRVLPVVILFSLWTTLWVLISKQLRIKVSFPPVIITALSIVIGMLLVFRTNGSNERYLEGCRTWENLIGHLKSMAEVLIFKVKPQTLEQRNQQIGALNLILAYAVATKHYLRNELGVDYRDLYPLIKHVPALQKTSVLHKAERPSPSAQASQETLNSNPTNVSVDTNSAKGLRQSSIKRKVRRTLGQNVPHEMFSNLPRRISLHLGQYIDEASAQGIVDASGKSALSCSVHTIVDYLNQLQRILRTPIPAAYSVSLKRILVLFNFLFPFQILNDIGYWTIPVTACVVFVLYSVEVIGLEIENPFGYDDNDLPIDELCEELRLEIVDLICEDPENFQIAQWTSTAIMSDAIYTAEDTNKLSSNWAKVFSPFRIVNHVKSLIVFKKKLSTGTQPTQKSERDKSDLGTFCLDANLLHTPSNVDSPTTACTPNATKNVLRSEPPTKSVPSTANIAGTNAVGAGIIASSSEAF